MNKNTKYNIIELLTGILFLCLGLILILWPAAAAATIIIIVAAAAIARGFADIFNFLFVDRDDASLTSRYLSFAGGLISIGVGILLLFNVRSGGQFIMTIFILWFILNCLSRMMGASVLIKYSKHYYYMTMICNGAGALLGVYFLFNIASAARIVMYLCGLYLLMFGFISIIAWNAKRNG